MQAFGWNRIPPALRVGFALAGLSQLAYLVIVLVVGAPDKMHDFPLLGAVQMAWRAGDVMCLVGAVELARRNPRAVTLVVGYALMIVLVFATPRLQMWLLHRGSDVHELMSVVGWVSFAGYAVLVVGWAIIADRPLAIIAVVLAMLAHHAPPLLDLYARLGAESFRAQTLLRELTGLVALGAMIAAAMGVPIVRGVSRLPRPGLYRELTIATSVACVLATVLQLGVPRLAFELVLVAALAGLAVGCTRARAQGEPGVWAMQLACAAFAASVMTRVYALLEDATPDSLTLRAESIGEVAGLVLMLTAVARIARGRGAEAALRVASACALIIVVAGAASVGASWGDTPLPAMLRLVGIAVAYGAGAYGLHDAGAALASASDLPTATVRGS